MFAGIAVLRRDRQRGGIADGLERNRARGVDVLADERGRHLERVRVVVVVALDVVLRQQRRSRRPRARGDRGSRTCTRGGSGGATRRGPSQARRRWHRSRPRATTPDPPPSPRRAAALRQAASDRCAACGSQAPRFRRRRRYDPATAGRTPGRRPGRRGCGSRSNTARRRPTALARCGIASRRRGPRRRPRPRREALRV